MAVVYGVTLLDEVVSPSMVAGLALILVGVARGTGGVRLPRKALASAEA